MRFTKLLLFLFGTAGLAYGQVADVIYVRENKVKREYKAFLLNYYVPEVLDSASRERFRETTAAQLKQVDPPLRIDDCVYFSDAVQHCTGEREGNLFHVNSQPYPPSLRFHTDRTKNYVDSLYSIHLFTTGVLAQYTQPFYFRKHEVTNAEYREFVYWVRDSVAMRIMANNGWEDVYIIPENVLLKAFIKKHGYDSMDHFEYPSPPPLNWKQKIRWDEDAADYKMALQDIYLPPTERFYSRKEIDTRKLLYDYIAEENGETIRHVLDVYPDTLCWVHDFPGREVEFATNLYFWHPAFDDYPVVGVNYHQAKAYLHWKTKMEQQKLNAKGIKLKIEYALPTEIEWEIAATSQTKDGKISSYGGNWSALADHSWLTDLRLDSMAFVNEQIRVVIDSTAEEIVPPPAEHERQSLYATFDGQAIVAYRYQPAFIHVTDTIIEKDGKRYQVKTKWYYWTSRRTNFADGAPASSLDPFRYTAPADLEKVSKTKKLVSYWERNKSLAEVEKTVLLSQLDVNGISFMGGNVSEWLEEDYTSWLPAFEMRLKMLFSVPAEDAQLEGKREHYFDTFNAKNGKLVRGANWFDERYGNAGTKNPAGMNAKTFVDPHKAHCTLGFRYVVHVK